MTRFNKSRSRVENIRSTNTPLFDITIKIDGWILHDYDDDNYYYTLC